MRRKLVEIWGEDKIKELEEDAHQFQLKKSRKLVGLKPDETFLRENLKIIQLKIKELSK
jgi:hypothetical protein